jgi:hypothetical protein
MAHERILDGVMQLIQEQNRQQDDEEFREWFGGLLAVPEDYKRQLKEDWNADVELQPLRWMDLGLELLQSPKVTAYAQLSNGIQGPPLGSYLPYPIFHSGTEIFLKGMWLCRHEDCRLVDSSSYVAPARRGEILSELRSRFNHNLLKLVEALQALPKYRDDDSLPAFLRAVGALVRRDYFPAYKPSKDKEWAFARYPKRFYDEQHTKGAADSYNAYSSPPPFIERLFRNAEERVEDLWGLRAGLAAKRAS